MAAMWKLVSVCSLAGRFLKPSWVPVRLLTSCKEEPGHDQYDVVIVGGGLAGTALACAIGQSPVLSHHGVLLLESSRAPPPGPWDPSTPYSNRVLSINPGSASFLDQLGVWSDVVSMRAQPVKRLQVWETTSDSHITFERDSKMEGDVAYVVENDVLMRALWSCLDKLDTGNVQLMRGAKVVKLEMPDKMKDMEQSATILLADGTQVHANLVVGADGFNSRVREALRLRYLHRSYGQMGIVATLQLSEETENNVAWQRFLSSGPIALLPLNSELSSLVWSMSESQAKSMLSMEEDVFVDAVNKALWDVREGSKLNKNLQPGWLTQVMRQFAPADGPRQLPPSIKGVKERAAFPLGLGHSVYYWGTGGVLIGDAAHRVHPLAGLGANLGLGDVKCLVQLMEEGAKEGRSVANRATLNEYETMRQRKCVPVALALDALHNLYANQTPPVKAARALGLSLVHTLPSLKTTDRHVELIHLCGHEGCTHCGPEFLDKSAHAALFYELALSRSSTEENEFHAPSMVNMMHLWKDKTPLQSKSQLPPLMRDFSATLCFEFNFLVMNR